MAISRPIQKGNLGLNGERWADEFTDELKNMRLLHGLSDLKKSTTRSMSVLLGPPFDHSLGAIHGLCAKSVRPVPVFSKQSASSESV